MCHKCNYTRMLKVSNLRVTENRLRVLEIIGSNNYPLSADDVFKTVERSTRINRVTVYRTLNALVDGGLVEKHGSGGRASYYGLAPNENHLPHPHFYCKLCGRMQCLNPNSLTIDIKKLKETFPGEIEKLEIRVDGICNGCQNA